MVHANLERNFIQEVLQIRFRIFATQNDECPPRCPQTLYYTMSLSLQVQNCQKNGALGVVVYSLQFHALEDMNCHGSECNIQLNIPATMIPFNTGYEIRNSTHSYIRFQTTPSNVFAFGIDGQGKVQETGWFLYPSIRFLAYQAQW